MYLWKFGQTLNAFSNLPLQVSSKSFSLDEAKSYLGYWDVIHSTFLTVSYYDTASIFLQAVAKQTKNKSTRIRFDTVTIFNSM